MWRSFFLLILLCRVGAAQSDAVASACRRYMESGSIAAREGLLRLASETTAPADASLARLVLGIGDYQEKKFSTAAEQLGLALDNLKDLADYGVYYRALALAANNNPSGAAWLLADFQKRFPSSPFVAPAWTLRAESLSLSGHAREAAEMLATPEPAKPGETSANLFLQAQVADRAGDSARAAQLYQRVYYELPVSSEQAQALAAINELRGKLGSKYPEPSPALRLMRADRLVAAQKSQAARAEYRLLSLRLKGLPREQASVRIGVCDYNARLDLRAYRWLKSLTVTQAEADAERLYYIAACARRLKRTDEFVGVVEQLGQRHPSSPWHEEALFSAGNSFFVDNTSEEYLKYYRALYEKFPQGRYAALAHWRYAWRAYLDRKTEARQLFEDHLRLFPSSPQITAAVYWLGRLAEAAPEPATARAYYKYLENCCPNYYYTFQARERLAKLAAPAEGAAPPASVNALLATIPKTASTPAAEPGPAWRAFLDRARLLDRLGMADLALRELRFRAETPQWGYAAGIEIAQQAAQRGNYHQAIRYLKRYTPGYLSFPLEAMPRRYWELLFPMPWRDEIESYSRVQSLDPYLVAALIRQESEFNPAAISRARARGLMQIMPSTGRKLGRNLGMSVPTNRLYVPDTSLKLGTLELRRVLDQYQGKVEPALAGYNAGEHRADRWLGWHTMEDPTEFVESIPFTETRTYVESVVRNAEIYRKLYGK